MLAVSVVPGTPSGHNKRYDACIASAVKARSSINLTVIRANSCVVEKIVFDGDGGKSKMPQIAKLAAGGEESDPIAELAEGEEDGKEDDGGSSGDGSSGSSVGGRETKEGEEDKAVVPKVVLAVPQGKGKPIFFCCADRLCCYVDDQESNRQLCINCNGVAHLICSENLLLQTPVELGFDVLIKDFNKLAKSLRPCPRVSMAPSISAPYVWLESRPLSCRRWSSPPARMPCPKPPAKFSLRDSQTKSK